MRHLFVALPAYSGQIWVPTMQSLFHSLWALQGTRIELFPILFEAMIGQTRSRLLSHFLASGATDMLFVDADLMWGAPAIERILSHPVDIVAGDYPRRSEPICYSTRLLPKEGGGWNTDRTATGLIEVEGVPTGFMRITQGAAARMVAAYPEQEFNDKELSGGKGCYLFDHALRDGQLWGEDYSFCRRFRAIGGKVFVDPSIVIQHFGFKPYAGNYNQWLEKAVIHGGEPDL